MENGMNSEKQETLKVFSQKLKTMLIGCGAVQFGEFTLASGKKSDYYINMKKASTDIETLKVLAEAMVLLVEVENTDRIAGVALGAVPIAVALSLRTEMPFVIVRKEAKGHGTGDRIEGMLNEGDKILFVEDVTTTGESLIGAVNHVREAGGKVNTALVVVDREEGAKENLEKIGVELISLLGANELKEH